MNSYEEDRIAHVNYVINEINDNVDCLYESFIDMEYDKMEEYCEELLEKINRLKQSIAKN